MGAEIVKMVESEYKREDLPFINVGDTVRVHVKIKEGDNERIQVFEGVVIAIKNKGTNKTFTVRRKSFGIGIERIFPFNTKAVDKIEIVRHGKVRRSKLYYIRKATSKKARLKEIRTARKSPLEKKKAAAQSKKTENKVEQKSEPAEKKEK